MWSNTSVNEKVGLSAGVPVRGGRVTYRQRNTVPNRTLIG